MPVQRCSKEGKPGWRWGRSGFCYTYKKGSKKSSNRAKQKAYLQGAAVEGSRKRGGKPRGKS